MGLRFHLLHTSILLNLSLLSQATVMNSNISLSRQIKGVREKTVSERVQLAKKKSYIFVRLKYKSRPFGAISTLQPFREMY